ncbi:MAG: SufS family cysteine desulfurase [Oscillatoriales cyanobacterium SM2_2_1]|nr:SufS family cysteine desulfurase [Oscillatoriales cyanobacterium SM2_2_1]
MALGPVARDDFPILAQTIHDQPLIYFDNAASSQKPIAVLDAWQHYYRCDHANVHRGAHTLSNRATEAYEQSREKVSQFINARSPQEIIFTRNASEAINLVAQTWGLSRLKPNDEILLTVMEHHSNIVPWQIVAQRTGAALRFVPITADGSFDLAAYQRLLGDRTKIVSFVHVSNTLGCITPATEIIRLAHAQGAKVLLDACQSVPHMPINVQELDCDWLVASGHKMCAPTGIGFLYGKERILEEMPPFLGGGEMIAEVYLDHSTYAALPHKFEAGTPAIGEAIALGAAVDYLNHWGMDAIHAYEGELTTHLMRGLAELEDVTIYGPSHRAGLAAFTGPRGVHANDIAAMLDQEGIAVRSGHHCTQPLHRSLGLDGSARASLYLYNTHAEVDRFLVKLEEVLAFFRRVL